MSGARCNVCERACVLGSGSKGACRARGYVEGRVEPVAYGRIASMAIDPVEKKPLARWKPGSTVLSVGGYGCNLHCPWCQNHAISQVGENEVRWREVSPTALANLAVSANQADARMVGVAYTYNEPLVCWEYVRDACAEVRARELSNVLVSAGCVNGWVIDELAPLLDAVNIDLKSMREETYESIGGSLVAVQNTITKLAETPSCHVEVTTLVVPGVNDTPSEMRELARWLANVDSRIVLHVSRFFPAWRKRDMPPTPVERVYELANVARDYLPYVYTGNC